MLSTPAPALKKSLLSSRTWTTSACLRFTNTFSGRIKSCILYSIRKIGSSFLRISSSTSRAKKIKTNSRNLKRWRNRKSRMLKARKKHRSSQKLRQSSTSRKIRGRSQKKISFSAHQRRRLSTSTTTMTSRTSAVTMAALPFRLRSPKARRSLRNLWRKSRRRILGGVSTPSNPPAPTSSSAAKMSCLHQQRRDRKLRRSNHMVAKKVARKVTRIKDSWNWRNNRRRKRSRLRWLMRSCMPLKTP